MRIGPSRVGVVWAAMAALLGAVLGIAWWTLRPPAPLPAGAPAARFSEGRARAVVQGLVDLGERVNGTPAHARAAEWLAAELRRIPGLEVEVQDVSDTAVYRSSVLPPFVYRTLNVVARLPGRSPESVLLDAHFDTLTDSVGAADDAAGVAALVESLRVLAREAPFAHTIVVNLNGGEEAGLFGAAGFLKHRWARDVRAYLYLEALPGGRAGLFGAGNPQLAQAYARVAPAPVGSVVGQDLIASGLLPHNGDFTPFHDAGLVGLDVAMNGDGWAYHDALDRPSRLEPGSLQHLGDTTVAVVRALASGPLSAGDHAPVVYYDVAGAKMVAYKAATGRALGIAALVLAALALAAGARRSLISARAALGAIAWTLLAVAAGIVASAAAGLLLARGLGRPHGWFSAPALVLPAFAAPALAAMLGVHAAWRRRALKRSDVEQHAFAAWAGGLIFWCAILAAATVHGVGAGYIALHWVWATAAGAIAWVFWPRARSALALAGVVPGAVVTVELGVLFLNYFLPITGTMPAPQTFDAPVAVLTGAVAVAVGVLACAVVHRVGGLGRASLVCLAVAAVGITAAALRFPYTAERPKRLRVAHVADDSPDGQRSALLLRSGDALGLESVLPSLPGVVPARAGWPPYESWLPPFSHERPAPPPESLAPPRLEVISDAYDATTDRRELHLRVAAPGAQMRRALPSARLLDWSLGAPPAATLQIGDQRVIHFEGLADDGAALSVTVRGRAPLPVELRAIARAPAHDDAVKKLLQALPPWSTTTAIAIRVTRLDL